MGHCFDAQGPRLQSAALSYCACRRESESKPAKSPVLHGFPTAVAKGPVWTSPTVDCDLEKCAEQTLSSPKLLFVIVSYHPQTEWTLNIEQ